MYPLKDADKIKRGYTFGVKTFYNNFHIGLDFIIPIGTPIYAVFDGTITNSVGPEGGNMVTLRNETNSVRHLHLSKQVMEGSVKQGDVIGYTGNTGKSTGPHLHVDCWHGDVSINDRNKMINPEEFFKDLKFKPMMQLIKGDGEEVYAVDKNNVRHGIERPSYLHKGFEMGLWAGEETIKIIHQAELMAMPEDVPIIFGII